MAAEAGVTFWTFWISASNHHATERYSAPAVAAGVERQFGLEHMFIDVDNPA